MNFEDEYRELIEENGKLFTLKQWREGEAIDFLVEALCVSYMRLDELVARIEALEKKEVL